MDSLVIYDAKPLTAAEIKAQVQIIQRVLSEIMLKDVHYGTIPGTPKPTLYKPGSEKILATFHISAEPREVEDLSTSDEIRYRVKVYGVTMNGVVIGVGVGECSSNEEKYKWRKPVCDEEFNETPEDRRRIVWKKGSPAYQQKQVRTNPADVANTVLKMAKKRAQIDMTLTATAASDVFDQDLEDMPDEIREGVSGQGTAQKPSKADTVKPGNGKPAEEKKTVRDTLKDELTAYCGGDAAKMETVLKELTVFEIDKDGKKEEVWMRVKGITEAKTKEAWVGKTLGKLRERAKKEGVDLTAKAPETKEAQPETNGCCGHIEKCEDIAWHGDTPWCDKENRECKCPL